MASEPLRKKSRFARSTPADPDELDDGKASAVDRRAERDEMNLLDLPQSLLGKIFSYSSIWTTTDVAKLREVSKSFGRAVKDHIRGGHAIRCPDRRGRHLNFIPSLIGMDKIETNGPEGDFFEDWNTEGGIEGRGFHLFPGEGVKMGQLFVVETELHDFNRVGKIDFDEELTRALKVKSIPEGEKGTRANMVKSAGLRLREVASRDAMKSMVEDVKSKGLFDPIKEDGEAGSPFDRSEVEDGWLVGEDLTSCHLVATFDVPEESECILSSTGDGFLEIQAANAPELFERKVIREDGRSARTRDDLMFAPMHPLGTYLAPVLSTKTSDSGKKIYRVIVLIRSISADESLFPFICGHRSYTTTIEFRQHRNKHQHRVGLVEGVAIVDDAIGEDLVASLTDSIDALASHQTKHEGTDYHPHSNGIVRDIVHPALFAYVEGISKLRASAEDVEPCKLPLHDDDIDPWDTGDPELLDHPYDFERSDFWGRNEYDKHQWLPTYFDISPSGKCTIEGYINGLTPKTEPVNQNMYETLALLFENALPYMSSVYSYTRSIHSLLRGIDEFNDEEEFLPPEMRPLNILPYNLAGHKLQVITKIIDYELKPRQSHEGVWHVEGMSQEDIVLTALYILDRDESITGGELMFKRAFLNDEAGELYHNVIQAQHEATNKEVKTGLVPLGKVETPKGRLIVFPNSHVHRVSKMVNESAEDKMAPAGKRRIVVFFLVNPLRRIVSTREVAPQKGGAMTHDDALKHRLELMKVRKFRKEDWNVREVELCEH